MPKGTQIREGDDFIYIVKLDYSDKLFCRSKNCDKFNGQHCIGDIFGLPYLFFSPHNNVYGREKKVRSTENFGK